MKRDAVDFQVIPLHQDKMHLRLDNWARWCEGPCRYDVAVGFGLFRSDEFTDKEDRLETEIRPPVNVLDAHKMQKGVSELPEKHRKAVQWYYVVRSAPIRACRQIACTPAMLVELVDDGRQMLINRNV